MVVTCSAEQVYKMAASTGLARDGWRGLLCCPLKPCDGHVRLASKRVSHHSHASFVSNTKAWFGVLINILESKL